MELYKNKRWLEEKYIIEQLSMFQIGKLCKASEPTIRRGLKKFKIKSRTPFEAHMVRYKRDVASYMKRDWLYQKYVNERLSTLEIAQICKVYHATICKWLKKFNIKTRSLSNALKGKYIKEKSSMYGIKGKYHHRWGIKHTEEAKRIIGEKGRGRKQSKKSIEKRIKHLKGKKRPPFSQEWKDNISKATKKLWANPEFVKAVLYGRSNRPTKPEEIFNQLTLNIVYYVGDGKLWQTFLNGKHKNPDFKVTGQNKVIEIFGDYWHRNDDSQELIDLYKQIGFDCLIIWEHEIYNQPEIVKNQVDSFII